METAEKVLSPRLQQVADLRADGMSTRDIAAALNLSVNTVENYSNYVKNGEWGNSKRKTSHYSPREVQIREMLGSGKKNKEIAGDLGITEGTVKVYISRLMSKTGMNRHELALAGKVELIDELQFLRIALTQKIKELESELSELKAKAQAILVRE